MSKKQRTAKQELQFQKHLWSCKAIADIVRQATDVDLEIEFEDTFNPRSGHSTRDTGTKTVVLCGVPAAEADKLKKLLETK